MFEKKFNQTIAQEGIEEKLVDTTEIIKMLNNFNYSNYKGLYYETQYSSSKMLDIYIETFHLLFAKNKIKIK